MQKMRYTLLAGTTVVLATVGLSACGGSTNTPATPTATTSGAPSAPSNGAAAARGARARLFADPKVQQCLDAAGIKVPQGRPSGSPRPSSSPQPGGGAAGAGSAEMQKITAALKACGITVPTRPRRGSSPATPTTTTPSP